MTSTAMGLCLGAGALLLSRLDNRGAQLAGSVVFAAGLFGATPALAEPVLRRPWRALSVHWPRL